MQKEKCIYYKNSSRVDSVIDAVGPGHPRGHSIPAPRKRMAQARQSSLALYRRRYDPRLRFTSQEAPRGIAPASTQNRMSSPHRLTVVKHNSRLISRARSVDWVISFLMSERLPPYQDIRPPAHLPKLASACQKLPSWDRRYPRQRPSKACLRIILML